MAEPLGKTYHDSPDAPPNKGIDVVPSDTVDFDSLTRAIWVGQGGNVVVVWNDETVSTLQNVPDGFLLPAAARRINQAGTTASQMVAFF